MVFTNFHMVTECSHVNIKRCPWHSGIKSIESRQKRVQLCQRQRPATDPRFAVSGREPKPEIRIGGRQGGWWGRVRRDFSEHRPSRTVPGVETRPQAKSKFASELTSKILSSPNTPLSRHPVGIWIFLEQFLEPRGCIHITASAAGQKRLNIQGLHVTVEKCTDGQRVNKWHRY